MNKPKHILFLLHIPPPVHGSSVVGLSIQASVRLNQEFDCSFINLLASQKVAESGNINLVKILGFVKTWFFVLRSLVRNRPQLSYLALSSTGAAFYKDLLLVMLLKMFRVKRIYHLHNKGFSDNRAKFITRIAYEYVFSGAEVIILSKYLYDDIKEYVPKENVHYCANGIPINKNDNIDSKRVLERQNVRILFLSNLLRTKGLFVLLEACKILLSKQLSFNCQIIGGEGDITVKELQKKIKCLGIQSCVQFQGEKYGKEKEKVYVKADVFTLPTYNECFPLVLLEAMQFSLPVVSVYEGGIPDIVVEGETGYLVPKKDAAALASKLEILIDDKALRLKMGREGRKRLDELFSQEIFEARLLSILKKAI